MRPGRPGTQTRDVPHAKDPVNAADHHRTRPVRIIRRSAVVTSAAEDFRPRLPGAGHGLTRRSALTLMGAVCGTATSSLLAGCASRPTAGAQVGASAAAGNATLGPSDTFPVTVEHALGRTTVATEPTRVVSVGPVSADVVIALGLVPLALPAAGAGDTDHGLHPWTAQALEALGVDWDAAGAPTLVGRLGLETSSQDVLTVLADLRPDLILGVAAGLTQDQYDALSAIAPTIARPVGAPPLGGPWDQEVTLIGRALGRSAAAEALVRGTQTAVTRATSAYPHLSGATYQALRLTLAEAQQLQAQDPDQAEDPGDGATSGATSGTTAGATATAASSPAPATAVSLYTQADPRSRFLELIGLRLAGGAQDAGAGDLRVTTVPAAARRLEQLTADLTWADLDPASLAVLGLPTTAEDAAASPTPVTSPPAEGEQAGTAEGGAVVPVGAPAQALAALAADPVLSQVPAVAAQEAYILTDPQVLAAVAESSPLSLPWLCDHHLPELAQRVEALRAQASASASASRSQGKG